MKLSERIASLEPLLRVAESGLIADFRVIEMHVARAEEKLLNYEKRTSAWTRPDLLLKVSEAEA